MNVLIKMKQSKLESFIETTLNISTGFILSFGVWKYIVTPLIQNGYIQITDSFNITMIFTIISFLRSLAWRRFFTNNLHRFIHKWLLDKKIKKWNKKHDFPRKNS